MSNTEFCVILHWLSNITRALSASAEKVVDREQGYQ